MFTSNAKWPESILTNNTHNITTDKHDTLEQAEAVCKMLESDGFGGDKGVFPLKTWTDKIKLS